MLVLSRKQGESIMVGDDVVITISSISRGRVKVCIQAPRDRAIRRTETFLWDEPETAAVKEPGTELLAR